MSAFETPAADPDIISEVLRGQKDRFQELVQKYQKMVYAVAWSQLGEAELAEEAAQQTFVKAYTSLSTLRDTGKFKSWIAKIARNVSVSLGRLKHRELSNSARWEIEPVVATTDESTPANLTEELTATLAKLPDAHRQILTLFYFEGQSIKRVAETLNLSTSAVKTRLCRARKVLRSELERRLGESLSGLSPSKSLVLPIMANLSQSTIISGVAKVSLISKATAWTGILAQLGGGLVSMLPAWWLSHRSSKRTADLFKDEKSNDFRRKIVMDGSWKLMLLLTSVTLGTIAITTWWSVQVVFFLIAAVCGWAVWVGIKGLRVNDSKLARAGIACSVLWAVVSLAVGICLTTQAVDILAWGMAPIAVTMLVHFLILYSCRNSSPPRTDYNLFLRAATGGLEKENEDLVGDLASEEKQLQSFQLTAFAKFLGKRLLITDYQVGPAGLEMQLPAVRASFRSVFGATRFKSRVSIDRQGKCEVFLTEQDEASIRELVDGQVDDAQQHVRRAVRKSLGEFAGGNLKAAELTLCGQEAEIFKPEAQLKIAAMQRKMLVLVCVMVVFLSLLWPGTEWLMNYFELK